MWLIFAALVSGDILSDIAVKYSGETMTWTACAATGSNQGDFAQFVVRHAETDFIVSEGDSPRSGDTFVYEAVVPRVGLYAAKVRSCNNGPQPLEDRCSEWVESADNSRSSEGSMCYGPDYVYAILAPVGPPEL